MGTQFGDSAFDEAVRSVMHEAAARAILPRWRSLAAHEISQKAADDVVTVADRESEDILAEGLARLLPEAAIVGEEACFADPALLNRLGDALCWIVDVKRRSKGTPDRRRRGTPFSDNMMLVC